MVEQIVIPILILGLVILVILYKTHRRLIAWWFDLPPPQYRVTVERNVPVPMPDGVILLADHYQPKKAGMYPTILIRSPYGRGLEVGPLALNFIFYTSCFAERGYHVIIQGVRGLFGSEGEFEAFVNEAADGQATVDWIVEQPWFNGVLGLWGPSYLGYAQWAIAVQGSPYLKAIVPSVTFSQPLSALYADNALALDMVVREMAVFGMAEQWRRGFWFWLFQINPISQAHKISTAFQHLPLIEIDKIIKGKPDPIYRQTITDFNPDNAYWRAIDYSTDLAQIKIPTHLISGWYDPFLRELLNDYVTLKTSGNTPYLTIGPWTHLHIGRVKESLRSGIIWFHSHLTEDEGLLRKKPVRVYIMGANKWRELDSWPPPSRQLTYFLHCQGQLSTQQPELHSTLDHYQYNPGDPTPAVGGALIAPPYGPKDNRTLEARTDVLCYTTAPLSHEIEVIGTVRLELYIYSNLAHTDFFGRLCDVHPNGRSINICDGLFRITPGKGEEQNDGSLRIKIDLWSTAYLFRLGHRLRLQVSSGAHPRWNRNLGTNEPMEIGTKMVVAEQVIYHDKAHPSALILPVTSKS